jgi:hypothetical protein
MLHLSYAEVLMQIAIPTTAIDPFLSSEREIQGTRFGEMFLI